MTDVIIPYRFVCKRDTAAAFTAANTLLKSGEWALETDTRKMKMGDGTTGWNSLAYFDAGLLHTTGNETAAGNKTFSGTVTHSGAIANTGILTPTQITANTDNYAPTGHASVYQFRLSTDASRNLTGLQGGSSGRMALLTNVGTFSLVLVHDATSTAANRFYCPGTANLTLKAGASAMLRYDSTVSRWRVIGTTARGVQSIVAGSNVTVDNTDPANPVVAASTSGGGGAWSVVKKAADESRSSANTGTTLTDDASLQIPLAAGASYRIRGRLFFKNASTQGFKYALAYSGTLTSVYGRRMRAIAGVAIGTDNETTVSEDYSASMGGAVAVAGGTGGVGCIEIDYILTTTTAGTFTFQWAQNTSSASNTTLLGGNLLEYLTI